MKEIILQLDNLLAMLEVRGNSVILLADARKIVGDMYRLAEEAEKGVGRDDPREASRSEAFSAGAAKGSLSGPPPKHEPSASGASQERPVMVPQNKARS